ncbi:hypothetical protein P154DRAFT_529070 [Amniculicola lignicola CBS 123094]|uniref:Uncharacterized protein n=1 Tax=Amniculicola lignicola CBS 123094 TaxID=1392246 RepID=A0A6A5X3G8_9PLEO|nr:hypothetical protein P154DRAFT_529070 [Amniculicola lignicola CBS 123094]
MKELISNPGVKFWLFQLDGKLTYSLTLNNKPPKEYELADSDFEGVHAHVKGEDDHDSAIHTLGTDASGVGVSIRLIKNDGTLRMEFLGNDGGVAHWSFNGLEKVGGGTSTGTQTPNWGGYFGIQTGFGANTGNQTHTISANRGQNISSSGETGTGGDDLALGQKRKATDTRPPNKLARTKKNEDAWPRFLFMRGKRISPGWKGQTGLLCIDVQTVRVWYEGSHGCEHTAIEEKRYVDLRKDTLRVEYALHAGAEHCRLALYHHDSTGPKYRKSFVFTLDHFPATCPIYGNNDGMPNNQEIMYPNATIIADALVHCIDITSRREPVHDPEAELAYRQKFDIFLQPVGIANGQNGVKTYTLKKKENIHEWQDIHKKEKARVSRYKQYRKMVLTACSVPEAEPLVIFGTN